MEKDRKCPRTGFDDNEMTTFSQGLWLTVSAWRQLLISCTVQTAGQVHYKCTGAGIKIHITVPSKVCALRLSECA